MPIDRRRFIGLSACALAGAVTPGCASVALVPVTPVDGVVRIRLSAAPQLLHPGGYLKVQPAGAPTAVYILVLDDGSHAALSPICTHLGCTVDIAGARLVCPCHGSTYARDGSVLRGPAERALRSYPVETRADEILVRLEGA